MSPQHYKPKLASVRQLKAARALAGLTQKDLGRIAGVNERQIRFWEKRIPTRLHKLHMLESALLTAGIECFADPAIGVKVIVTGHAENTGLKHRED